MRKRTCNKFFDVLMWTTIYMLPIFIFLIMNYAPNLASQTGEYGFNAYPLADIVRDFFGLGTNLFSDTLVSLFGGDGILPLFNYDDGVFVYLAYLLSVNILHIFVDIILALPRFCHKFLDKFTQDEE